MINVCIPLFPVSVNHMYVTKRLGRFSKRVLSAEARSFKSQGKTWLAQHRPDVLAFFDSAIEEYSVLIVLHMNHQQLYNKERAGHRHKKIDASNYIKVVEDMLTDACGHDDRQHMSIAAVKRTADPAKGEAPFIEVYAWRSVDGDDPFARYNLGTS